MKIKTDRKNDRGTVERRKKKTKKNRKKERIDSYSSKLDYSTQNPNKKDVDKKTNVVESSKENRSKTKRPR